MVNVGRVVSGRAPVAFRSGHKSFGYGTVRVTVKEARIDSSELVLRLEVPGNFSRTCVRLPKEGLPLPAQLQDQVLTVKDVIWEHEPTHWRFNPRLLRATNASGSEHRANKSVLARTRWRFGYVHRAEGQIEHRPHLESAQFVAAIKEAFPG